MTRLTASHANRSSEVGDAFGFGRGGGGFVVARRCKPGVGSRFDVRTSERVCQLWNSVSAELLRSATGATGNCCTDLVIETRQYPAKDPLVPGSEVDRLS